VPVVAKDIPKTANIMLFRLFEFLRMPIGLRYASMMFQQVMDTIFFDLPCVFIYLDDLLIASRTEEEHREVLREVLRRLAANSLLLNVEDCVFGQRSINFLGHVVAASGVAPLLGRVAAICSFLRPPTIEQLQAILGPLNFNRHFVPAAAQILRLLPDTLRGGPRGKALVSD
jgi:Reverse transcriptase (RNA-dependent DNA polymerase)